MTGHLDRWKAICGDDLQAPHTKLLLNVHAETLLFASVPKHLKPAQETWLSVATPEEIAQELSDKLSERPSSGPAANAEAAQPSRKKARGGAKRKKNPGDD